MHELAEIFAIIRRRSEEWGVYLSVPLSEEAAAKSKEEFEKSFGVSFPSDYERFLAFSNGFQTQRGDLFSAESIRKWNVEHWFLTPEFREVPGGVVFESFPKEDLEPIEYLWIGSYGNM